jgi:serine protease
LGGGGTPTPPPVAGQIEPSPSSISFGATRTEADLVIRRVGTTTDRVISVTSSIAAITIAPKAGAVDANGLGTYVVSLNRTALAATAFGNITITTASRAIAVPVNADRRAPGAANGSYGPIYIIAIDADDPNLTPFAQASVATATNGEYAYSLLVAPKPATATSPAQAAPKRIVIFAGGDTDNDSKICNRGEACGAYPVLGNRYEVIEPRASIVDGISFSVTPYGGINPTSQSFGTASASQQGLSRIRIEDYLSTHVGRKAK